MHIFFENPFLTTWQIAKKLFSHPYTLFVFLRYPQNTIKLGKKTSKKNLGPSFDATLDQALTQKPQILDQVLTLQHIYTYIYIYTYLSLSLSSSPWVGPPFPRALSLHISLSCLCTSKQQNGSDGMQQPGYDQNGCPQYAFYILWIYVKRFRTRGILC